MQYKLNSANTSAEAFIRITIIINLVAMAFFFETICHGSFEHLLATGSKDEGLLDLISTYFGIVEINGRGILHLHCLYIFMMSFI